MASGRPGRRDRFREIRIFGVYIAGSWLLPGRKRVDTHLLSACYQRLGLVLAEVAVPEATNEVGAVGPLLERLLSNETVTFDAAFTQYAVASQVVHQGGAYFLVLKGNQPTLLREAQHATSWPARYLGRAHAVHLAHGRLEDRTLVAASAQDLGWPHARQVLRLHRRFTSKRTGAVLHEETVYDAVTSLRREQASPQQLLQLWQAHWRIESLHWLRDVVFGEDRATTHTGHAPQALAALRNLAISFIHRWRGREVTAAREYYASHPAVLFCHLGLVPRRL